MKYIKIISFKRMSAVASLCAFGLFCVVCSRTAEFELPSKRPFTYNLLSEIGRKKWH